MIRFALITAATLAFPAHIEHFTEAQNRYLQQLHSKGGTNCCTAADGATVKGADWGVANGKFWVVIDGERREVPDAAIVEARNPMSDALVWVVWMQGVPQIKCFLPGHLS